MIIELVGIVLNVFLFRSAEGRTRQKTLLDVTDRLSIYNRDDGSVLEQVELRQFPYVTAYSKNTTIEGELCYSLDLNAFIKDC